MIVISEFITSTAVQAIVIREVSTFTAVRGVLIFIPFVRRPQAQNFITSENFEWTRNIKVTDYLVCGNQ